MVEVEMNMIRALKVWWSFIWRTWVLMIPVSIVALFLAFTFFVLSGGLSGLTTGGLPNPSAFIKMGYALFALLYLVLVPLMLIVQVFAFKLALKAVWSDFRLVPVGITIVDTPAPVVAPGTNAPDGQSSGQI